RRRPAERALDAAEVELDGGNVGAHGQALCQAARAAGSRVTPYRARAFLLRFDVARAPVLRVPDFRTRAAVLRPGWPPVARRLRRGIEDLLLDPGVNVELAADALDGRPPLACGDVARHAPHETGQHAAALEAGEELLHAVVVLLDELDDVHVIPPR